MKHINPLLCIDFYKADHRRQYPDNTTLVVSNLTPRSGKYANVSNKERIVFFGLQYFIKDYLIDMWNEGFFKKELDVVLAEYKRVMDTALGKDAIPVDHIVALHRLGYLPVEIKALPEGSLVPVGVPCMTIHNTKPEFFWLTNYLETILSNYLWLPCTSATTAFNYKQLLCTYAKLTGTDLGFVDFQAHDFSFRGMGSLQSALISGAAHLTSFKGTDTVAAITFLEEYYYAGATDDIIGCSVPATEHSVMCMGTKEKEIDTFKRLLTDLYPGGIVSIVSDTWDFWQVIGEYSAHLKGLILAREGKVVFRPDSGDPVKIICGDPDAPEGSWERKGAVEVLWNIFGGTTTEAGYKLLDSHVGLIYGDSISYSRCGDILFGLERKGFASGNVVFGVGSYTYQHVTRDTWGFAVKATYGMVDGVARNIYKDPKTDDGIKKSAKGLLMVTEDNKLVQEVTWEQFTGPDNYLRTVYKDGVIAGEYDLQTIRDRLTCATK